MPAADRFPWFALKVRARAEQLAATALEGKGYQLFLPTYIECRQYSDRIKKINAALFPGYLFCALDPDHRLPILQTPNVEHIVSVAGVPVPVDVAEIEAIRRLVDSGLPAIPWPQLGVGQRAVVQFGAMAGLEGTVMKIRGEDRLILSISLLQRSVSVEIERAWIRPLD